MHTNFSRVLVRSQSCVDPISVVMRDRAQSIQCLYVQQSFWISSCERLIPDSYLQGELGLQEYAWLSGSSRHPARKPRQRTNCQHAGVQRRRDGSSPSIKSPSNKDGLARPLSRPIQTANCRKQRRFSGLTVGDLWVACAVAAANVPWAAHFTLAGA